MDAVVIGTCVALVLAGALIVVRDGQPVLVERSWPSYVVRLLAAGLVGGALATGAGGRLVMRLLALTSPESKGALTEAQARIGEITAGGTLGFFVFVGLPAGVLCAGLFAVARPALPRGRLGGAVLGLVLLILAGSVVDPLRSENFDFALVGPDWLAVIAFVSLAIFQGLVVRSLALRAGVAHARPRLAVVGAGAVALATLVALPGFVVAVGHIVTSG
ncbi:MAG TPA: hypothetical protein VFG79_08930 [Solirubrobacter sp.]|nr:hypothetical protein [Solirubrobacter sp.]